MASPSRLTGRGGAVWAKRWTTSGPTLTSRMTISVPAGALSSVDSVCTAPSAAMSTPAKSITCWSVGCAPATGTSRNGLVGADATSVTDAPRRVTAPACSRCSDSICDSRNRWTTARASSPGAITVARHPPPPLPGEREPTLDDPLNLGDVPRRERCTGESEDEFCAAVHRLASDHDGIARVGEQPDAIRLGLQIEDHQAGSLRQAQLSRPGPDRPLVGALDLGVVPNTKAGGLGVRLNDPERVRGHTVRLERQDGPPFDDRPFVGLALDLHPRERVSLRENVPKQPERQSRRHRRPADDGHNDEP